MKKIDLNGILPLSFSDNIVLSRTTAIKTVGKLDKKEKVITFDKPWEGNHCVYQVILKDEDKYVMYYLGHDTSKPFTEIKVCRVESKDLISWYRPSYNLREFNGNKDNNIILDETDQKNGVEDSFFDNFFVFKDTNEKCNENERYKALAYKHPYQLECFFSKDGIEFVRGYSIDIPGRFDTVNTCFYDNTRKKYFAFIRDFHNIPENGDLNLGIRDIRVTESEDFRTWSKPEMLKYSDKEDCPLYINNITKYPGNNNYFIGFPARYIERKEWTDNYDKLCGRESRLERMQQCRRYGLAITDGIFMISNDGLNWERYQEALVTPGMENGDNWVYGDGYLSYGIFEKENEYSLFMISNEWSDKPTELFRYEIRKDGFAYYYAPYIFKKIQLKKGIYRGGKIFLNFSTSAAGCVYVTIKSGRKKVSSCEMFGDSVKREISIDEDVLKEFIGKEISLEIKLKDAKVYSIIFDKYD